MLDVSIPLSRDSLCNRYGRYNVCVSEKVFQSLCRGTAFATLLSDKVSVGVTSFNPSIEGQPLQLSSRGEWYAFGDVGFNPSIEGQPLQRSCHCMSVSIQSGVSIPLSRDSLCNFIWLRASIQEWVSVSIPLSRDSLCNVILLLADEHPYMVFQSLYRGTAFATGIPRHLVLY